jgi:hypothetical protein
VSKSHRPPWSGRVFVINSKTEVVAIFRSCLLTEAIRCAKRMFPGQKLKAVHPGLITGCNAKHLPVWRIRQWCEFTGVPISDIIRPDEREYARALQRAREQGLPRPPFKQPIPVQEAVEKLKQHFPKVMTAGGGE